MRGPEQSKPHAQPGGSRRQEHHIGRPAARSSVTSLHPLTGNTMLQEPGDQQRKKILDRNMRFIAGLKLKNVKTRGRCRPRNASQDPL